MSASVTFSPYLWCFDRDSHYFRQLDFYTAMHNGILFEPRLSATYQISGATAVTLDVLYRHVSSLIGDVTVIATGTYTGGQQSATYPNGGGASMDSRGYYALRSPSACRDGRRRLLLDQPNLWL